MPRPVTPLRYWIENSVLAGGACPSPDDLPSIMEEYDVIISLLDDERQYLYSPEEIRPDVRWINVPMTDHATPSLGQLAAFYDALWDSPEGARVYVHCLAGIGRTGTVAASYLVWRGVEIPRAFEQVDRWTGGFFTVEIGNRVDEVKNLMRRFRSLFCGEQS